MRDIARATVRDRKAGFAGVFIAVLLASMLVTALGTLMESGIRGGVPPQRYAGATVVVGGAQTIPVVEDVDTHLSERVRLPAEIVDDIGALPGVESAAGDISIPVTVIAGGRPVAASGDRMSFGHGWSSAALAPFTVRSGAEPTDADDVVLTSDLAARARVGVGDRIDVAVGSVPHAYTVTGIATAAEEENLREEALFFTDQRADELSADPGQVDAVGVIARPGVSPDQLAAQVETALAGRDVRTYTGDQRADAEFLDVGRARTELVLLTGSFAGTSIMIAMFVVASTLTLSVQQRRREFALLRAVAATPRQIHRLIGSEILYVAGVAAVTGTAPGFILAHLMKAGFAAGGLLPDDFGLAFSPIPAVASVLLCLGSARIAGWIAARKPARTSPTEALGQAAVEPAGLSRTRMTFGWLLGALGLASSTLPVFLPGSAALAGAAGSVLLLVIAVALLGPSLMAAATAALAVPLRRVSSTAGYLAAANTQANSRRLAAAVTPLILAIAIVSVQLFAQSTVSAAAGEQSARGVVADFVVTSSGAGLSHEVTEAVAGIDQVAAATPVVRGSVLVRYREFGETTKAPFSAQGIEPDGLEYTLDLDVRQGTLGDLREGRVAVSQLAADTFGVGIGDSVDMTLGDGTEHRPTVAAIYGRGLGFGDVTLPRDVLAAHTTTGLDSSILVGAVGSADAEPLGTALRQLTETFPELLVADAAALAVAGQDDRDAESWTGAIALLVLFGYLAVSVVNTLVMATAERGREFALLQLVGAARRQVERMMWAEVLIIVVIAAAIGTLVSVPPLAAFSLGMTESALPAIPVATYAVIIGVTALLAAVSIGIPTRTALRAAPVRAAAARE
ncbi:FtsX-like permease family protein [Phytoactinopolyspora alkaliphila]|uniref:FtsX-like permease family protein n=1 Tax=Phytoactinopolyspora alkaliphila TaxID=1783498 RepID=A0A6N9YGB2_9ACTN|nr:FtsX-like permease family protein [Phytoactinopolyspora alkaliphila]NED94046.1 FtsX-like permease family protein [Phytoactinopolyspora alkaliphila]